MLRWITRLVLLLVVAILAPGEAAAFAPVRVWPPAASAEKLASWGCDPETAVLRQAATMQAAETQQAASSLGYDFASGRLLAAESAAPRAYSVAYRTRLAPESYPGVSRGAHFQEANGNLLRAMEGDASFAKSMRDLGVNLERTPTGLAPRQSPASWTWHHADSLGELQLVPRFQHAPGSAWQELLHPGGQGGYSIWGK